MCDLVHNVEATHGGVRIFIAFFFCFVVAMCDLVHNVEATHGGYAFL